jgi:hypothetical protein
VFTKDYIQSCDINLFVEEQSYLLLRFNKNINVISGYTSAVHDFDIVINFTPTIQASNFCSNLQSKP